jgi:hypothetical protein
MVNSFRALQHTLVEEDQAVGIESGLPGLPASPPAGDVRAGLLNGEQCFF